MASSSLAERCLRSSTTDASIINNITDLAAYIKKINTIQNKKMDEISAKIDENTSQLNNKIDMLCHDMDNKITALGADVNISLDVLRKEVDKKIHTSQSLAMIRLNDLERRACLCDLLVHGIPHIANENVNDLFKKICIKIGIGDNVSITSVFRIKSSNVNSKASPIIVKCASVETKQLICNKYFSFKNLCLKDVDIDSSSRIYINECLTKLDNNVMKTAMELRKQGKLYKVAVRNGQVVVKWTADSSFTRINAIDLENLENSNA